MQIKLYNTLSRTVELFAPMETGKVRMYTCGPTVYDFAHIGNLRMYTTNDILRRVLVYAGYEVEHVMNVTDVGHLVNDTDEGEDKMTKALRREGKQLTLPTMLELGKKYIVFFLEDIGALNIWSPHKLVRASDHIKEDIELIKQLEEKGFVYRASDGLYFDTDKFPAYGQLGNINLEGLMAGARATANPEKKNPRDFSLWKLNPALGWESPWGRGFPGWHIECSAMAMKYLGENLDIHTGGIDLMPTHHNNEIAQSEAATGKQFVRFWLHGEHLQIGGKRMGKSEGNAYTLADIKEKGFDPLDFRYFVLTAHYRQKQNFTWEALDGAREARRKLMDQFADLGEGTADAERDSLFSFETAIADDLNMPRALSAMWELLKNREVEKSTKRTALLMMDTVLGLRFDKRTTVFIPPAIAVIAEEREKARQKRDWTRADNLRKEIEKAGFDVRDTENGPTISRKR